MGSYATIYLPDDADIESIKSELVQIPGMAEVYDNEEGCNAFQLANDRMGDLILVSQKATVLGTTADRHDLSGWKCH